jgi:hypothetical protein
VRRVRVRGGGKESLEETKRGSRVRRSRKLRRPASVRFPRRRPGRRAPSFLSAPSDLRNSDIFRSQIHHGRRLAARADRSRLFTRCRGGEACAVDRAQARRGAQTSPATSRGTLSCTSLWLVELLCPRLTPCARRGPASSVSRPCASMPVCARWTLSASQWGDSSPLLLPCIRFRDIAVHTVIAATGGVAAIAAPAVGPVSDVLLDTIGDSLLVEIGMHEGAFCLLLSLQSSYAAQASSSRQSSRTTLSSTTLRTRSSRFTRASSRPRARKHSQSRSATSTRRRTLRWASSGVLSTPTRAYSRACATTSQSRRDGSARTSSPVAGGLSSRAQYDRSLYAGQFARHLPPRAR